MRSPVWPIEVRMENTNNCSKCWKHCGTIVAVVASFLLVGFLVKQMVNIAQPQATNADRAAARAKDNTDIRAASSTALANWGNLEEPKTARAQGYVRMPIAEAMKLTVRDYQNAGSFHSNLTARAEKANAAVSYE